MTDLQKIDRTIELFEELRTLWEDKTAKNNIGIDIHGVNNAAMAKHKQIDEVKWLDCGTWETLVGKYSLTPLGSSISFYGKERRNK